MSTRLIHPDAGDHDGPSAGGLSPALDRSSTFRLDPASEHALATGEDADRLDVYGRYGTSTTREAARLVARLEGSEAALLFASGTAAVATVMNEMVAPGSTIVAASDLYGGTEVYLREELTARGVQCVRFATMRPDEVDALLQQTRPKPALVWCESISNPLLHVASLRVLGEICARHEVPLAVDNTFGAGMAVRPLEHGATVVVHSATKYLNGHSDVVAGVACGSQALVRKLWVKMTHLGGCIDPAGAWLLARGIRTLPLRWHRQCATARELATSLVGHPAVDRVHYPGLPDHPSHEVARRELDGFGAMVSFDLAGGANAAATFVSRLRLCNHAPSLGGLETLVCVPARSSHARLAPQERARLGIRDGLIRMSVGLEDVADLEADLNRALDGG